MAMHLPGQRRADLLGDDVEDEIARTAELVLRLTALAERYADHAGSDERVALILETAERGRRAIAQMATEPSTV